MSREEPAPNADAEPEVEFAAVDVDEIVRQERVRAIFDARRECRETRRQAKRLARQDDGGVGRRAFRDVLEGYVREVEPLFAQTESGQHYWTSRHFGDIHVTPSLEEMPGAAKGKRLPDGTRVTSAAKDRTLPVHGLNTLFELTGAVEVEIEVEVPSVRRGRGKQLKNVAVNPQLSMSILDEMYSAVNSYLAEIGFDVEVGKAEQHTQFDDDLVDELKEWRENNL